MKMMESMSVMSEKYILARMTDRPREFRCPFFGILLGKQVRGSIKIDTGAGGSLFPLRTLQFANSLRLSDEERNDFYGDLKRGFLDRGLKPGFLHGVERTDETKTGLGLYDRRDLTFRTDIRSLIIENYSISDVENIRITCDTTGNVLLGMDILSKFDFHCGLSRVTGEYIFLGCLRDRIEPAYLSALREHFGDVLYNK